ncbi:MAG: ATP-binding protein [Planctomycetota bacterium]|jgi:CO dehydrogenase maturation factor
MKVAVSGKGGVGKTTLSAMLAAALALKGRSVIALDADPDANLASCLGTPPGQEPAPLAEMRDLIAERTGSSEAYGGYFKLNPKVDDIPEKYAARIGNIRLLVLGGIRKGGDGCLCPATALLKALLVHLALARQDALVMDMEAGLEHLGRATAQSMDALIVVVDCDPWSHQTACRILKLAGDIGMKRLFAVANRVTDEESLEKISDNLGGIPLIGHIAYDERIRDGLIRLEHDSIVCSEFFREHFPSIESIISEITVQIEKPS